MWHWEFLGIFLGISGIFWEFLSIFGTSGKPEPQPTARPVIALAICGIYEIYVDADFCRVQNFGTV